MILNVFTIIGPSHYQSKGQVQALTCLFRFNHVLILFVDSTNPEIGSDVFSGSKTIHGIIVAIQRAPKNLEIYLEKLD